MLEHTGSLPQFRRGARNRQDSKKMISPKDNVVTVNRPERFSEVLGLWAGSMIAPLVTVGSLLRQARVFHPRGIYFQAKVEPAEDLDPQFTALADGLSKNDALMRLSAGMSKMRRGVLPDVLGIAVRFNTNANNDFAVKDATQDLLMATSRSVLTLPLAALRTNHRDFLANLYYGMGCFEIEDQPGMRLRLTPLRLSGGSGEDRYDMLREAIAEDEVAFLLETASASDPDQWFPLVRIRLISEVKIDDRKMSFWPFYTGQGIKPRGFIQYMRPVPYLSSQWARLNQL
jgi:hypothetical protein